MSYLAEGEANGLITFNENRNRIRYTHAGKTYNFRDPEEQVRAEIYLQLVLLYGYAPERIDFEVVAPFGTRKGNADLVVFEDDAKTHAYIIVECKKTDATDAEFNLGVDEGFSYAATLKAKYLMVTSITLNRYFDTANFGALERIENVLPDIPRFGKTELSKAKYYKGAIDEEGEPALDLETITQSALSKLFERAHDVVWDGGRRDAADSFDEISKLLFCKIWDEKRDRKPGQPYDFQVFKGEAAEVLLKRLKGIYAEGRSKDPEVFQDDIKLDAPETQTVVSYFAKVNIGETDLDAKGRAFEKVLSEYFRGKAGQFFTPRSIVEFITAVLPLTNESLVLDTSCGSGGFLLYALNKIRQRADRMADEGYFAAGSDRHKKFWHDFAQNNLCGIELNDKISRTAKMNMIIHDDGHTNVISLDALNDIERIQNHALNNNSQSYRRFAADSFDFILTNPPFGSIVKANQKSYLGSYTLGKRNFDWIQAKLENVPLDDVRDSQKSEILFIEQCHKFLKAGAFLAIVLPDGILTNSSLQYVREWIETHFRIVAVVSLPQTAFTHTGAGVKSSVLFLRKLSVQETTAIKTIREEARDSLFARKEFGGAIQELLQERAYTLKKGDLTIQEINETLVNHIAALREQHTLERGLQRQLERDAKAKIDAHKTTDEYKTWAQTVKDEYAERLEAVKESLNEAYLEAVKERLGDYPIFMAIAEDIGYDATGRPTRRNELAEISGELRGFIEAVIKGKDRFFASASV